MIPGVNLCEVERRDVDGLHPCGRTAGHDGDHVCALAGICGVTWAPVVVVVSDHLGPCADCAQVVRAGTECSGCLEDAGQVRHARHCVDQDCGPVL